MNRAGLAVTLLTSVLLTGCFGSGNSDLRHFIETTKASEGLPVEPAPEVPVVESYTYMAGREGFRSPFVFAEEELEEYAAGDAVTGVLMVSTLGASRDDRDYVVVAVEDTGPGVPPEYHDRVFDKFAQIGHTKNGLGSSTGLGLTFCKMAVEAHGGRIWVDSAPGEGSVFTFSLPLEAE